MTLLLFSTVVELCSLHRLTEEKMVYEWMAFSTTKTLPLTVANLCNLEHEVSGLAAGFVLLIHT